MTNKQFFNWLKEAYKNDKLATLMHVFRVAWLFLLVAALLGGAAMLMSCSDVGKFEDAHRIAKFSKGQEYCYYLEDKEDNTATGVTGTYCLYFITDEDLSKEEE